MSLNSLLSSLSPTTLIAGGDFTDSGSAALSYSWGFGGDPATHQASIVPSNPSGESIYIGNGAITASFSDGTYTSWSMHTAFKYTGSGGSNPNFLWCNNHYGSGGGVAGVAVNFFGNTHLFSACKNINTSAVSVTDTRIDDGNAHQLVVTIDGSSNAVFYIDGAQVSSQSATGSMVATTQYSWGGVTGFAGNVAGYYQSMALFTNTVLSSTDVANLYAAYLGVVPGRNMFWCS